LIKPHKPRLCIGLPVYNGEKFLAQAIESLLGQTFSDFRLVVSDNASTDGTPEICRSYAARDPRIEYVRADENRGAAWNFNRLVPLADSPYFKWHAYDDLCEPEFVARCVDVLDRNPAVVLAYTKSHFIDAEGRRLAAYHCRVDASRETPFARFRDLLANLVLCHMQFGVIRLAVLRQTLLYGPFLGSDKILLADLALRGAFHEVDDSLFLRRNHPERSLLACRTPEELRAWFAPGARPRQSVRWARLAGYLRTITRAPIPLAQKVACAFLVLERPLVNRTKLGRPSEPDPWPA
jgi:glycosyltransferase involved in cell wall biosynthesis